MVPFRIRAVAFSLTCVLSFALAQDPAIATTGLKPYTYQGCFSSSKPLSDQGSWTYQSPGYCQGRCVQLNKAVMGTTAGSNCYCGDQLPVADSKVPDSKCNTPCFGYDKDSCVFHPSRHHSYRARLIDIRWWIGFLVRLLDGDQ